MLPGRRSDNGSIFVIQGTPPAGTPLVAGIALSPLGAIYINGGQLAWSPADLFQNNEQGAWYDPSDLSTMFQDSAGTIPVTADGQPVGKILDKSGNGNDASQANAASMPQYKTDGTYSWLEFDGVDDALVTSTIDLTATDNVGVWAGAYRLSTGNAVIVGFAPILSEGSFQLDAGWNIGTNTGGFIAGAPDHFYGNSGIAFPMDAPFTLSLVGHIDQNAGATETTGAFYVQGVLAEAPSLVGTTAKVGYFQNEILHVGESGSANSPLAGRIYSLIVRMAASGPVEISDTEAWVNGKTGAY